MADHSNFTGSPMFNSSGSGAGGMYNHTGGMMYGHRKHMMMHMTFYWGKNAIVLFPMWPGFNANMYVASLALVFAMGVAVEWLSHNRLTKPGVRDAKAGLGQTAMYTVRVGVSYMLMLAVMSFNGGIFIAAMAGMGLGFFFFGSRAFEKKAVPEKPAAAACAC